MPCARSEDRRPRSGLRRLVIVSVLLLGAPARAAERVYVALGASGESPGIVRPGDAARVGERLRSAGAVTRVVDLTAPLASLRQIRQGQLTAALAVKPAVVTLALGPADACGATTLAAFSRDLQIVADLLQRTRAQVVITTPHPLSTCAPSARASRFRREAFHWAIVRIARRSQLPLLVLGDQDGPSPSWLAAVGEAVAPTPPDFAASPRPSRHAPDGSTVHP